MQSKSPRHTQLERLGIRSEKVLRFLAQRGRFVEVPRGAYVFDPDGRTDAICLLLSGTLRVEDTGREKQNSARYSVWSDEKAFWTAPCLIPLNHRRAQAMAETAVGALLVGRDDFDRLMVLSQQFRAVVFGIYSGQIADLLAGIGETFRVPSEIVLTGSELGWGRALSLSTRGSLH
ncbi:cyclic nucleotide-binding domain-containing protein [Roseobacter sp. MH60115]|uniref:cyclic nucleotide-binding domain-containing protein n=1 Tax=Roseobacter sp. MH60115 TaxID=2785324 RepID=UPI0018A29E3F|nr:cyclic nucleotide-binding domain-containing protein [Roseobacter sp. MH60115]